MSISIDEALMTIGSKEGLAHLMLATLDHGDTVLVPNPSYRFAHLWRRYRRGAGAFGFRIGGGWISSTRLERAIRESYRNRNDDFGFLRLTGPVRQTQILKKWSLWLNVYDVLVRVHDLAVCHYRVRRLEKRHPLCRCPARADVAVDFHAVEKL